MNKEILMAVDAVSTRRASQGNFFEHSKPRSRPRPARNTAKNWTCALRSTARPALTTPFAAGRCLPTIPTNSKFRSAAAFGRWRDIDKDVEPGGYVEQPMDPCPSAAFSRRPPSRSSCRRCAKPNERRSSMPTRIGGHPGQRDRQARRPQRRLRGSRRERRRIHRAREMIPARARAIPGPDQGVFEGGAHGAARSAAVFVPHRPEFLIELFKLEVPE